MSAAELGGWVTYWSIEPTLEDRIDIGFAQLMAMMANINRDSKKRPEPFSAVDFMPHWTKEPEPAESEGDVGMAPDRVLRVMEEAVRAQKVQATALAARQRADERGH